MDVELIIVLVLLIVIVSYAVIEFGSAVFYGMALVVIGLLLTVALLLFRRAIKKRPIKHMLEQKIEKRRTLMIEATVTKVENMIWKYSQMEDAELECTYIDKNEKKHIFTISGVVGKFTVTTGDKVKVLVDEKDWSNYQILLEGIVE